MMTANQDQHPARVRTLEVSAFRYSENPGRVGAFLELIGLSPRISNREGSWLELQAAAGSVSVHSTGAASTADAESGRTDLVLIASDVPAYAAELTDKAGVDDVVVWDEAFGHQAAITVGRRRIIVNEIQPDPYGYQVHHPTPGPVTVVSHCFTKDFAAAQGLFTALGFRAGSSGAGEPVRFESPEASGVIILHRSDAAEDRYALGFEIAEDLNAVVGRLRDAGFNPGPAAHGRQIAVTDPDGQSVTINAR